MTESTVSSVLSLLQPELLSVQELCEMLKKRCCRLSNLETMSKENLVKLFRKIILPLPQRLYRANRRGTILTARRMKAGLEGNVGGNSKGGAGRGSNEIQNPRLKSEPPEPGQSRLKPPPILTQGKIQISSTNRHEIQTKNNVEPDDTRRLSNSTSPTKISLKRTAEAVHLDQTANSGGKKQRVAIKWP